MKRNIAISVIIATLVALVVPWQAVGDRIGVLVSGTYYSDIGSIGYANNSTIDSHINQTIANPSTVYFGDGSNLTGIATGDNETLINRLSAAEKANAITPVAGTAGTFSGAVTASELDVTRGSYEQCVQLYEALGGGNESIRMCAPAAGTDTYRVTLPAAKPSAINQSRRCSAITSDNCTEEWFTALSSTQLDDNASHTVDSTNSTTTIPTWRAMIAWVGSFFERRTLYQVDNATALRCGAYYDSNTSKIFTLPTTVYDGCEAFLSEYPGKTNVIQANPGATGYISNQANTGWCTQGQTLDSGGAATDKLGVVADNNGTVTRWLVKSATGTWECKTH